MRTFRRGPLSSGHVPIYTGEVLPGDMPGLPDRDVLKPQVNYSIVRFDDPQYSTRIHLYGL